MEIMRLYSPASELAAAWLSRLHKLNLSLLHDPSDSQTPRLQIEAKVLSFLLLRYGNDPTLDYKAKQSPTAQRTRLQVPEYTHLKKERSTAAIQEILRRLVAANRH